MTWFTDLTGCIEESPEQVRQDLHVTGPWLNSHRNGKRWHFGTLRVPTLAELRKEVEALTCPTSPISFSEHVGDVQSLHLQESNAHATFQVASQFNLLEMLSPNVLPEQGVGIYENDPTQGPACAIAAGAGTIYRNYFVTLNSQLGQTTECQIDCVDELAKWFRNADRKLWSMRNGYLFPTKQGLGIINSELTKLDEKERNHVRGLLRIGIQENTQVTLGNSTHCVTQVLCSAVPVAYSGFAVEDWEPLGRLILEATYEATFCVAQLQAASRGNPNLYLTLVGGGAFGNRIEWITEAIERSLGLFQSSGLHIKLVSFGRSRPEIAALVKKQAPFR